MVFTFTGVRRPRVERARLFRALLGGALLAGLIGGCATSHQPSDVSKGSLFAPVVPPISAGAPKLPVRPAPQARYAGTGAAAKSARSSFVATPDSLRADTLALRRFAAGRQAAYAASPLLFRSYRHKSTWSSAPPLPAFLRPADPAQATRAAAAYSLGYAQQLAYAPPQENRPVTSGSPGNTADNLAMGIFASVGYVALVFLAFIFVLNILFAPFGGFFANP